MMRLAMDRKSPAPSAGVDAGDAAEILRAVDPDPSVRAERLGLDAFAAIARSMLERGWTP